MSVVSLSNAIFPAYVAMLAFAAYADDVAYEADTATDAEAA